MAAPQAPVHTLLVGSALGLPTATARIGAYAALPPSGRDHPSRFCLERDVGLLTGTFWILVPLSFLGAATLLQTERCMAASNRTIVMVLAEMAGNHRGAQWPTGHRVEEVVDPLQ